MQRDPYPDHVGARDGREAGEQVGCCRPPSLLFPPEPGGSSGMSRGGSPWCLPSKLAKAAKKNLKFKAGGGNQDDL